MTDMEKVYHAYVNGVVTIAIAGVLNLAIPLNNLVAIIAAAALIIFSAPRSRLNKNPLKSLPRKERKELTKNYKTPLYLWAVVVTSGVLVAVLSIMKSEFSLHAINYFLGAAALTYALISGFYCIRLKSKIRACQ